MNRGVKANLINERNAKIKLKTDRFLKVFIIVFLVGYGIFFTSNIWMPASATNIETTKPGTVIYDNENKVMLLKWSYSKEDNKIEAVIKRENFSIEETKLKWVAFEKHKGKLKTETIAESENFAVIHINNLPYRWSDISLRLEDTDGNGAIKLYVTKNEVEKVKHIADLNIYEYEELAVHYLIDIYKKEINKNDQKIENLKEKVVEAEGKISEFKYNQKFETDLEKEDSNQAISDVESEITNMKNKIDELDASNEELNKKINLQKLKLE